MTAQMPHLPSSTPFVLVPWTTCTSQLSSMVSFSRISVRLIHSQSRVVVTEHTTAVIDRQFKGDIAHTMDKLTTRALQAQVEAANVDRENSNKIKQEEGALSVARVKAQSRNVRPSLFNVHSVVRLIHAFYICRPKRTQKLTASSLPPAHKPNVCALKPRHRRKLPSSLQRLKQRQSVSRLRPMHKCLTSSRGRWS